MIRMHHPAQDALLSAGLQSNPLALILAQCFLGQALLTSGQGNSLRGGGVLCSEDVEQYPWPPPTTCQWHLPHVTTQTASTQSWMSPGEKMATTVQG